MEVCSDTETADLSETLQLARSYNKLLESTISFSDDHLDPSPDEASVRTETVEECTFESLEESGESPTSDSSRDSLSDGRAASEVTAAQSSEYPEDASFWDNGRIRRNARRKLGGGLCCPVCGISLRSSELDAHLEMEIEKLARLPKTIKKHRIDVPGINMTYVRVKCNRENRLTAKVSKYAAKAKKEVQCPVCELKMSGREEEINKHVALCFQNENSDEELVVDAEDEESFEEYEFGDETRIRAISLVPGGYRTLQGTTRPTPQQRDEEGDLNVVDLDDAVKYGQPQYSELDVITNRNDEDESEEQLRKAVLLDPTVQPLVLESRKWDGGTELSEESKQVLESPSDHVVSSLKQRIQELQDDNKDVKCLICMEAYTKPVVSTTCWHVYCEECWLMTMGVKKLCPQCNMIVFPSDLRRIYL